MDCENKTFLCIHSGGGACNPHYVKNDEMQTSVQVCSTYLNDCQVHHAIGEEVPFCCYSREVGLVDEDLIHSKDPQVAFQVHAVSAKGEFGHVKHEAASFLNVGSDAG